MGEAPAPLPVLAAGSSHTCRPASALAAASLPSPSQCSVPVLAQAEPPSPLGPAGQELEQHRSSRQPCSCALPGRGRAGSLR